MNSGLSGVVTQWVCAAGSAGFGSCSPGRSPPLTLQRAATSWTADGAENGHYESSHDSRCLLKVTHSAADRQPICTTGNSNNTGVRSTGGILPTLACKLRLLMSRSCTSWLLRQGKEVRSPQNLGLNEHSSAFCLCVLVHESLCNHIYLAGLYWLMQTTLLNFLSSIAWMDGMTIYTQKQQDGVAYDIHLECKRSLS